MTWWSFLCVYLSRSHQSSRPKTYSSSALVRNLVAVGYPTAVFVSDLSYFALFATKQNPHYVEMVLIVTVAE